MTAEQFFQAFDKAAASSMGFVRDEVSDSGFNPWEHSGMHDAAHDWDVERRINFRHGSARQSETIQLDILVPKRPSNVEKLAAIFIRIHDAGKKPVNTAHATLKSHRRSKNAYYFIEFKGKRFRKRKIRAALSKNKKLRLEKNRILIGTTVDLPFIKHLVLSARLLAHADN